MSNFDLAMAVISYQPKEIPKIQQHKSVLQIVLLKVFQCRINDIRNEEFMSNHPLAMDAFYFSVRVCRTSFKMSIEDICLYFNKTDKQIAQALNFMSPKKFNKNEIYVNVFKKFFLGSLNEIILKNDNANKFRPTKLWNGVIINIRLHSYTRDTLWLVNHYGLRFQAKDQYFYKVYVIDLMNTFKIKNIRQSELKQEYAKAAKKAIDILSKYPTKFGTIIKKLNNSI